MARSAWLQHVMKRSKNKGMAFKDVLKKQRKVIKKVVAVV